jgi:TonB family protein
LDADSASDWSVKTAVKRIDLEKLGLFRATTISMLAHIVCAALLLWGGIHVSNHLKQEQLQVVRVGVLSDRQIVGLTKGSVSVSQVEQEPAHERRKEHKSAQEKPTNEKPKLPEEKPVASNSLLTAPNAVPKDNAASSQGFSRPARSTRIGGEIEQVARTTSLGGNQAEDPIGDYISMVAQLINSHLIYPKEMKKHGIEGICRVAFTVLPSGEIETSSLRVVKSSGQNSFDTSALKTVVSCVPFRKPPRKLAISLSISFTTDRL